jgi:hypothetical protein
MSRLPWSRAFFDLFRSWPGSAAWLLLGFAGQLLKALAQANVSSTTLVTTASGKAGTVADIFQDAVMQFRLEKELEFMACSLALWLPAKSWTNQFGATFDFDDLFRGSTVPSGEAASVTGGQFFCYDIMDLKSPVCSTPCGFKDIQTLIAGANSGAPAEACGANKYCTAPQGVKTQVCFGT